MSALSRAGLLSLALLAHAARAAAPPASDDTPAVLELRRQVEELRAENRKQVAALEARIAQLERAAGASAAAAPAPTAAAASGSLSPGEPSPSQSGSAPSPSEPTLSPSEPTLSPSDAALSPSDAALEAELAKELAAAPQQSGSAVAPPSAPSGGGGALKLIDLSLNALTVAGASTRPDADVQRLFGGGHDPHERGFTVQNVELSLAGAVDPWLRGDAHVVLQITPDGETSTELEEAYLTTQVLPHGLQLKAGQFFTEFGRMNPQHPHQWHFVDQPVVLTRLLGGDGMRGPGARLSWLLPVKWYSEVFLTGQDARGETAASFFGPPDEEKFAGHPLSRVGVSAPGDLMWSARWLNSVDLGRTTTLNLGASGASGPNSTGGAGRTRLLGLDAYLKWTRPQAEKGFPFVAWQAELLQRRYDAAGALDSGGSLVPGESLTDWGAYSQVVWGFRAGWAWGVRAEIADGEDGDAADNRLDPLRDRRVRLESSLTWFPSEFSKLRFQLSQDRAEFLGAGDARGATSAWIQWEFNLGAHGAHQF